MSIPVRLPHDANHEDRRFSGRWLVVFVVALVILAVIVAIRNEGSTSRCPRVKLADGTWLVARGVSVGTNHSIDIPYALDVQLRRWQFRHWERRYQESHTSRTNRMVIWLTRENDRGDFLAMDWFRSGEVSLADGTVLRPAGYHRKRVFATGSQGWGVSHGGFIDAVPIGTPPTKVEMALIHFELPLVRPSDGTMLLDVYDGAGKVVAQLRLPYPELPNMLREEWHSEPLPQTHFDGDVSVTLTSLKAFWNSEQGGISLLPQLMYLHDGRECSEWVESCVILDQIGNESQLRNCDLSLKEPAWKLGVHLSQESSLRFLPSESMKLPVRPLTASKQLAIIPKTHTVNGLPVTLVGQGGTGPVEFTLPGSMSNFKTADFKPGQDANGMMTSCSGSKCDVRFDSGHAFLITDTIASSLGTARLIVRDQAGELLPIRSQFETEGKTFWFFEPLPTSTDIEIEVVAKRNRYVEFIVVPPKLDEIGDRQ